MDSLPLGFSHRSGSSLAATRRALSRKSRAALGALGDSITARANSVSSPFYANTPVGYLSWVNVLTGQRFYSPPEYNFGVNGYSAGNVLSTSLPLALAAALNVCIVHVGTNDAASGIAASTTIANLTLIYDQLQAAGVTIIAIPILGRNDGLLSAAEAKEALRVNDFIRQCAYTRTGFHVADCGVVFDDPTASSWVNRSTFADDNLHSNNLGAYAIGRRVADVLDAVLPGKWLIPAATAQDVYDASAFPRGNLDASGMMLGTGGTTNAPATGDTATGWVFTASALGGATAVLAKDTFADGRPAQKLTLSGSYDGTTRLAQFNHSLTAANFGAGDVIEMMAEFDFSAAADNVLSADILFQSVEGGVTYQHGALRGATVPHTTAWAGVLQTYKRTITATPSSCFSIIQVLFKSPATAQSIAAVVKFGSVAVRKL